MYSWSRYDKKNKTKQQFVSNTFVSGMLQFSVFVDVLAELPLPFIWLNIHYVGVFILHLCETIITVTATLNSLSQAIPCAAKHRIRTCALICLVLGCLNMFTVTEGGEAYDTAVKRGLSFVFLIINVFSVSGIVFIYGVKTLKHDILFIYGSTLTPLFWFSITLLPIVLMVMKRFIITQNRFNCTNICSL